MCQDNQDENYSNSGFILGLVLGAIIGAVIAILIYRKDRDVVIAKFKKKFEDFLNQFNSSPPSPSTPKTKPLKFKKPLIASNSPSATPFRKPKMFLKPKK